ncbi:MAG: hypothetical protein FP831_15800 [Anaerolineae bacterium]|nr:hypothetical protein [Anaerolineae bacterium]
MPAISPFFGFVHKNEKQSQRKLNFFNLKKFVLPVPESRELPWHSLALAASAGVQPHRPDVLWEGKCALHMSPVLLGASEASGERRVLVPISRTLRPTCLPLFWERAKRVGFLETKTNQVIGGLSA